MSLGVGLASVILISIYVIHELSFNRFHQEGDQIYRVAIQEYKENQFELARLWMTEL